MYCVFGGEIRDLDRLRGGDAESRGRRLGHGVLASPHRSLRCALAFALASPIPIAAQSTETVGEPPAPDIPPASSTPDARPLRVGPVRLLVWLVGVILLIVAAIGESWALLPGIVALIVGCGPTIGTSSR